MKIIEKVEKALVILTASICVIVPILDFIGALDNFGWLTNRVPLMTMLSVGVTALYLIVRLQRIETVSEDQTNRLLSKIITDEAAEEISTMIYKVWKEREIDINRLFDQISTNSAIKSESALRKLLNETFHEITSGDFLGTKYMRPGDFTLTAINFNGDFIYHPTESYISTRAINMYPYADIFKLRNGNIIWLNEFRSEQFAAMIDRRLGKKRLTMLYFREYSKLNAIVVFESHINLIHRLRQIDLREDINQESKTISFKQKVAAEYKFEIIEGIYASKHKQIDVTQKLIESIRDNTLDITASNKIAGDPDPGYIKKLKIRYKVNDEETIAIFKEGEQVQIP